MSHVALLVTAYLIHNPIRAKIRTWNLGLALLHCAEPPPHRLLIQLPLDLGLIMVRGTLIARVSDGLPLAQNSEDQNSAQLAEYASQAKLVVRRLGPGSEPRCSIESGAMTLHYLVRPPAPDPSAVVYVAICEKSYPRKLAFAYLDELAAEFGQSHGPQVAQRTLRPYAFVAFDTFIQRTTRLYADARTAQSVKSSNLDKLNEDLADVTRIMTKNMEDLLWRGDSLDRMFIVPASFIASR